MKEYSTFPKALQLELHPQIQFSVIYRTLIDGRETYPSAEMQSAYCTMVIIIGNRHDNPSSNPVHTALIPFGEV